MPIYKMDGKKNGKQKYRVRINYQDGTGKPRQIDRVAYGLEEAKQLERELQHSVVEEPAGSNPTLRELHEEYCISKRNEVRESTADKSKSIMEQRVLPELGDVRIQKLSPRHLRQWKTGIEEQGFALNTKQNYFAALRRCSIMLSRWSTSPKTHALEWVTLKMQTALKLR